MLDELEPDGLARPAVYLQGPHQAEWFANISRGVGRADEGP